MRVPAEAGKRRRGVAEVRRESAQPAAGSGAAETAGKRCGRRGCSARTRPRHPRSQRPHDTAAVVPAPSGGVARSWEAESRQQQLGDMWAAEARRQQLGELGRRRPRDSGSGAEPGGGGLATAALARRLAVRSSVGSGAELGGGGPAAAARQLGSA